MLAAPMIGIGPPEIILIIVVLLLLFGATKLPELARGSGRALRIFKSETRGLMDDDEDQSDTKRSAEEPRPLPSGEQQPPRTTEQPNPTHRPHES